MTAVIWNVCIWTAILLFIADCVRRDRKGKRIMREWRSKSS